jgi:hypothetical protein
MLLNKRLKDQAMHNKKGYILFLLFSVLSVCSILISLCFSRTMVYQQLMNLVTTEQQCQQLALSSVGIAQAILTPQKEEKEKAQTTPEKQNNEKESPEKKLFTQIFPYFNKEKKIKLTEKIDHFDATITISLQSEHGKLNLNSLYDFDKKKFINEGKPNDCRKLCIWLFEKISQITGKPNLMTAFENILKKRELEFNDPLELLTDKDFKEQFTDNIFINFEAKNKKLFLTDIFTVYTEAEDTNKQLSPWLFSISWQTLLDLKTKESKEDIQTFIKKSSGTLNWKEESNSSSSSPNAWNDGGFKDFYQKEYKDLPQEIKSILTTSFEANIFSLLVKARIAETVSSIFTIVKAGTKQHLTGFDILKTSQI